LFSSEELLREFCEKEEQTKKALALRGMQINKTKTYVEKFDIGFIMLLLKEREY